jgi:phosphatidate cytidylyltransferase
MSMDSNLVRRVGFAVVAIPLALALIWYGGLPLALVLGAVAALGARELIDLAGRGNVRPLGPLALLSAAALPLLVYAGMARPQVRHDLALWWPYLGAIWLILLLTWVLLARTPTQRPLSAAGITVLAVAYTGALPAFLLAIRHTSFAVKSWAGAWLVFFPLVVTWVCDTAAMFGGRSIGGPKLAPTVSPGKTRAGSTAGVLGGLLMAPVFGYFIFPKVGLDIPLWQLVAIAAVLSIVGQIGDLVESLFKREAGVKDSSHLIPGHGGVLDRFDSLYFVIPAAAAMYRAFGVI